MPLLPMASQSQNGSKAAQNHQDRCQDPPEPTATGSSPLGIGRDRRTQHLQSGKVTDAPQGHGHRRSMDVPSPPPLASDPSVAARCAQLQLGYSGMDGIHCILDMHHPLYTPIVLHPAAEPYWPHPSSFALTLPVPRVLLRSLRPGPVTVSIPVPTHAFTLSSALPLLTPFPSFLTTRM